MWEGGGLVVFISFHNTTLHPQRSPRKHHLLAATFDLMAVNCIVESSITSTLHTQQGGGIRHGDVVEGGKKTLPPFHAKGRFMAFSSQLHLLMFFNVASKQPREHALAVITLAAVKINNHFPCLSCYCHLPKLQCLFSATATWKRIGWAFAWKFLSFKFKDADG